MFSRIPLHSSLIIVFTLLVNVAPAAPEDQRDWKGENKPLLMLFVNKTEINKEQHQMSDSLGFVVSLRNFGNEPITVWNGPRPTLKSIDQILQGMPRDPAAPMAIIVVVSAAAPIHDVADPTRAAHFRAPRPVRVETQGEHLSRSGFFTFAFPEGPLRLQAFLLQPGTQPTIVARSDAITIKVARVDDR